MFHLNIKLAFRNLLRNKVYSLLIIGGFAIGFAACILIVLFYHTETSVNKDFANHRKIFRIYDVNKNRCNLNWDLFPVVVSDYAAVEDACPLDYQDREQLTFRDEASRNNIEVKHLVATTNNFFSIFSVEILESISGMPFEGKESIAISSQVARSLYGNINPLGRQVNIGNYFYGTVTSVFKELPVNSSFSADVILNSANEKYRFSSTVVNGKKYNPTNIFVMVEDGNDPRDFADELNKSTFLKSLDIDRLALQGLDEIYLSELTIKSRHAKGNPALLKIFLAIAILILILSSINYLNYSVSIQYARLKSCGIKLSFGAGSKDLVYYTIVEVTIGVAISLLLALFITDLSLTYSRDIFGKALQVRLNDLLAVAPVFLTALIIVILINSLAPLYILSKFRITEFLSGFRSSRNSKQLWKQVLLTFQLTASIALIAIVMLIYKQIIYLNQTDPGFDHELLLRINIPYRFQQTEAFRQELAKLSFVKNTSLSSGCPGMINHKMGTGSEEKNFDINCIYIGDNYLNTMSMDLVKGRDFLEGDFNKACILNEEALRQYGWESFEGRICNIGQDSGFEVIGIIEDFKFESLHFTIEPLALLFTGAEGGNVLSARLEPGNISQQIEQIAQVWKVLSPDEPFSYVFYDDFFQSMYQKEEKLASTITFFSLIAICLTCMGILGQIFMICLSRVKEIGIRKINGARISEVLILLNQDFVKWIVIAILAATPISWVVMHKWLKNFAYKTSLSWWIFVLAGVIALMIVLLMVSWQSWRAATRNPVEALRYE